jgi:hypothetical protein
MNIPNTAIDFEALLYALTQQVEPIPDPLQRSLQDVGQSLLQNHPDAAHQLRELIQHHPPLETAYKTALEAWDQDYASQQRAKSLNAVFPTGLSLDGLFRYGVVPSSDWIAAAKQVAQPRSTQPAPTSFWDKADRVAVVIAGGAALGGAIAQIPGAIVGAALAAGYGWYISVAKSKPVRNF